MNNKTAFCILLATTLIITTIISACSDSSNNNRTQGPVITGENTETNTPDDNNIDHTPRNPTPADGFPSHFDADISYAQAIYVSPSGDDTINSGLSVDSPFQTIERAVQLAMDSYAAVPVVINMAAGDYGNDPADPSIVFEVNRSATAPLKILGETGPQGQLLAHFKGYISETDPRNGLHIRGGRYLVLDSLRISGYANAIHIEDYAYRGQAQRFNDRTMATQIIIRNSHITAYKDPSPNRPRGNNDAIKISGVNHFLIVDNIIETGGQRGSGIDAVGCHDGIITGNMVRGIIDVAALDPNNNDHIGGSGIQVKGGSENILIHGNVVRDFNPYGGRAINAGGSSDAYLYRPSLVPESLGTNYEARNIQVIANIIINNFDAIAFPNCVDCVLANNTIVDIAMSRDPARQGRGIRLLNESPGAIVFETNPILPYEPTETIRIAPTQNIRIYNNIFHYAQADVRQAIQAPSTVEAQAISELRNNLWWIHDAGNDARPVMGTDAIPIPAETDGLYQIDPGFIDSDYRINTTSAAHAQGTAADDFSLDFDRYTFASSPSLGAFEAR